VSTGAAGAPGTVGGLELTHILDGRAFAKRDALAGRVPALHANITWTTRVDEVLASDAGIIDAIQLLAETEGIFTEPAGGTTLAAAIELVRRGVIAPDESVVVCVTGNGYKTGEVVQGRLRPPVRLSRAFKEFESWWETLQAIV
jgi:threonine synthase